MDSRTVMVFIGLSFLSAQALTVDDVLGRYEAALGGRESLDRIQSMEMFGTVEGMGLSGTTYSVQRAPDQIMERIDIGPLSYAWAHTPDDSWIRDQSGVVRTLSTVELEEFLLLAEVGGALPLSDSLRTRMHISAQRSDSSHVCIQVENSGQPVELYFRRTSGLLDKVRLTKLGMPVEARFSDFRDVNGLRMPFRGLQTIGGVFSLEMKVAQVKVNEPVSDAVFRRPGTLGESSPVPCAVPVSLNGHLVVPVTLSGAEPLRFVLDSGAGISCIDSRVASRLGLEAIGALPAQGVVGFDSVGVTDVPALTVGCLSLKKVTLAVVDLSMLSAAEVEPIHGILGYGLFSQRAVGRSGTADSLLLSPSNAPPRDGYVRVPIQFVANVPVVDAEVNGHAGRFLVDTGNSFHLILHTPFATERGLMTPGDELQRRPAAGIGGSDDVFIGHVDSVMIGEVSLADVPVLFSPSGRGVTAAGEVAGNIGLPLLERFDWVLDYQAGALYLRVRNGTHGF